MMGCRLDLGFWYNAEQIISGYIMKLAGADQAIIPREKIVDYLLSTSHPDGQSKANFFLRFGFTSDQWGTLANALRDHAKSHEVVKIESTTFGTRYVVEEPLSTPDNRYPFIRSVWFTDKNQNNLRFVRIRHDTRT